MFFFCLSRVFHSRRGKFKTYSLKDVKIYLFTYFYLRQVNGVNGKDTVFVHCVSVCVSVYSGPANQTSLKRLKLRTSNMTCMFPGTVRTRPLIFEKGAWPATRDSLNFWALNVNSSKWLKERTSNLTCIFPGIVRT